MKPVVIQIVGLVDGQPSEFDGQYVTEFDPGYSDSSPTGRPMGFHLRTAPDPAKALKVSGLEAFEMWRAVDPRAPLRPDGKPNRPLTAFTVSFLPAE